MGKKYYDEDGNQVVFVDKKEENKTQSAGEALQGCGGAMQGCGCLLILLITIPLLLLLF